MPSRPRLTVEISSDDKALLDDLLGHGYKRMVFTVLVKQLIEALQADRDAVIKSVMNDRNLRPFIPTISTAGE